PDKFVNSSGEKAEASKENSKSSAEGTKETGLPSYFLQDEETALLILEDATPFHEYTLSFLAFALWDPTEMYNHITNNWGDKPADIPFDIR
ncbi:1,3-beta-galactosyl-N-acetylhexosamine phosphorylase N-terminal domain-containing protein, partial [Oribacterium parvum]|uniref:1,3-beta-galactosyl-N-acetylhexosamine phosphorylase N-terminal domain-containing protein n=1 Tax=Oribacterium parvum TaxID=1501329 RepID=UPI002353B304